jgi:hypothetical protein
MPLDFWAAFFVLWPDSGENKKAQEENSCAFYGCASIRGEFTAN